jgi:hypothetical protein
LKLFAVIKLLRQSEQPPSPFETAKYLLRGLCSPASHAAWNRFLLDSPAGRARAIAQPQLVWKLQRSYLSRGTGVRCKLDWLRQHHAWVAQHWPADLVAQLYMDGGRLLAELPVAQDGVSYRMHLCMDTQFAKEGELVLSLWRCEVAAGAASLPSRPSGRLKGARRTRSATVRCMPSLGPRSAAVHRRDCEVATKPDSSKRALSLSATGPLPRMRRDAAKVNLRIPRHPGQRSALMADSIPR